MKQPYTLAAASLLGLLSACSQIQEAKNTYKAVATTAEAAKKFGENLEEAQALHEARKQRGDTVALSYKALQKYLPDEVAGFVPEGEPRGESMNMGGMSYSTCERTYRKGEHSLKVQIMDYNGANALYSNATAMMGLGLEQENDEELMRSCDLGLDGVKGYEVLKKKEERAELMLGVGQRFFVVINSDGQKDTELVKDIAKDMQLKQLAKL